MGIQTTTSDRIRRIDEECRVNSMAILSHDLYSVVLEKADSLSHAGQPVDSFRKHLGIPPRKQSLSVLAGLHQAGPGAMIPPRCIRLRMMVANARSRSVSG